MLYRESCETGQVGAETTPSRALPATVPDAEQRLWRTVMRRKYQITRTRVPLHNRLECLLEDAHIKLSSLVSDLLGTSARRILQAIPNGKTDSATLAGLADQRLRATLPLDSRHRRRLFNVDTWPT